MSKPDRTGPSLRDVPSVDQLLRTDAARELRSVVGIRRLTNIARSVAAEIRAFAALGVDHLALMFPPRDAAGLEAVVERFVGEVLPLV